MSSPGLSVVVFDLWGTLGGKRIVVSDELAAHFGFTITPDFKEVYERAVQRQAWPDYETMAGGLLRAYNLEITEDAVQFIRETFEMSVRAAELFPGMADLLSAIRKRVRLAILSNTTSFESSAVERWGIAPLFDVVIFSWQTGHLKPEAAAFERLLTALGHPPPQKVLYVDDNDANLRAAGALALRTHHFTNMPSLIQDVRCYGLLE